MQRFAVQDRERTFTFTGTLVAHASSRGNHQPRWAEISIYKTEAGQYVVAGVGRSVIEGETSRCWAHVIETAPGVVAALYQYDEDSVRYMTRVAKSVLKKASRVDEQIRQAFLIEEVA